MGKRRKKKKGKKGGAGGRRGGGDGDTPDLPDTLLFKVPSETLDLHGDTTDMARRTPGLSTPAALNRPKARPGGPRPERRGWRPEAPPTIPGRRTPGSGE